MKLFEWMRRTLQSSTDEVPEATPDAGIQEDAAQAPLARISSDRPIQSLDEDTYGLSESVVPRLQKAAVDWPASEGLILGLYGSWGIGKSSVLNMLEDLVDGEGHADVLTVSFNPWFYDDQAALITSFFSTIAQKLGEQDDDRWRDVSDALKKIGNFLAAASKGVTLFGVNVDVKQIIDAGALEGGEHKLDELRSVVEQALGAYAKSGGRLLILVDDVDRLTRPELLGLFRLLRIVGDLPGITIIVAMDEIRVHQLLAMSDDPEFGKSFTEKIVQAAVPVPGPSKAAISARVAAGLETVLKEGGFELSEEFEPSEWDIDRFRPIAVLTDLIETPRDLARYFNALRLFFLAGTKPADVHAADAVLVEALRVFFPDVYKRVQRNRAFFVERDRDRIAELGGGGDEIRERRIEQFQSIVNGGASVSAADRALIEGILKRLFGEIAESSRSPGDPTTLSQERRISSPDFFNNYFALHPAEGLITKREMDALADSICMAAETGDASQVARVVRGGIDGRSIVQISQIAAELGTKLKAVPVRVVGTAAKGVVSAVATETDLEYVSLVASLVEALKVRPIKYDRSLEEQPDDKGQAAEVLSQAASEITLVSAARLVEHAFAVNWLSQDEKAMVASSWIDRFKEQSDADLFEAGSAEAVSVVWRATRRAAGRIPEAVDEISTQIRDRLCRSLTDDPRRLPLALYQFSVISTGSGRAHLKSDVRTDQETFETLDNLIGIDCLRAVLDSIDENEMELDDQHGLVDGARELLADTSIDLNSQ